MARISGTNLPDKKRVEYGLTYIYGIGLNSSRDILNKTKISFDKRVKDLTNEDISERKLPKNTTGVVVIEVLEGSPLVFIVKNDIIVEVQKKKIRNSNQFSNIIKDTVSKGEKTLYLAIYNSSNQRSYITVKLK